MKSSNKKNNEAIIQIQKLTKPIFEEYGVEKAYVFGSYASKRIRKIKLTE